MNIKNEILKNVGFEINEDEGVKIATNNLVAKYRREISKLLAEMEKDQKKIVKQIADADDRDYEKLNQFKKVISATRKLLPVLDKILKVK
jgi:nicotinate-nucleotide pyrophosphorylase